MKIGVIGATGFVGSAILQEALQRGLEVTAIVRHPEKLTPHQKLRPHKGEVYSEDDVARLVEGHDAIISPFNPGWGNQDIYNLQVMGTRAIINGVKKAGIARLLLVGGSGSLGVKPGVQPWICRDSPQSISRGSRDTRSPEHAAKRINPGLVFPLPFRRPLSGPTDRQVLARFGSDVERCDRKESHLARRLCGGHG
jgi:nucleoside-diphosphate-sugar epimerase